MNRSGILLASAAVLASALVAPDALAQQGRVQQAAPGNAQAASLPPALQAAILSGNPAAVQRAITTLSGGNPQRAGALAEGAINAAEKMMATDPQAAVQVATAAVQLVRENAVQQGAPTQTQAVVTTAARILVRPEAARIAPDQVAGMASAMMTVANAGGNPAHSAAIAQAVIGAAEKMVATNPQAAVGLASSAMQAVRQNSVLQTSPAAALDVATSAARIMVQPEAQAAAPQAVAAIATAASQVVSSPAVYAVAPTAALNVMAHAYAAATSPVIVAAAPNVTADVRTNLVQAQQTQNLNQVNPTNVATIDTILGGINPQTGKSLSELTPLTPIREDRVQGSAT